MTVGGLPCIVETGGYAWDHISCTSQPDVVGPKNVRAGGGAFVENAGVK